MASVRDGQRQMKSIFTEIRTRYNLLSKPQKCIADFILNNPSEVILLSITNLAEKCSTSEPTILRFLRKLDYTSYQVFKVNLAQEVSKTTAQSSYIFEEISEHDSLLEVKQKIVHTTMQSIHDSLAILDDAALEQALQLLLESKRIITLGVGSSASIANDAYHKFSRLGLKVVCCNDPHMMSIICTHADPDEVILAFTHSGESREILDATELAKQNKVPIIVVTSYPNSSVTKLADVLLLSSTNEMRFHSDAVISRIIQLVIIDILQTSMLLRLGEQGIENLNKSRIAVAKKKT
ncbi:MAG: MurR/RpiR family transcriptional regulator [Sphaerochaeta sp.]|jgi:DNA-binding MurR/RpiR family transcriptional regulator|uniref:MurR/RpiR family transcriptional regulator n=1 Tax=Sphaerochaeta sp. TaxID=1972642 RepID=UPI002FC928B3